VPFILHFLNDEQLQRCCTAGRSCSNHENAMGVRPLRARTLRERSLCLFLAGMLLWVLRLACKHTGRHVANGAQ
jgi:hypothetical protein